MSQGKPVVATTSESNLSTLISGLQAVLADPPTLRYYTDRDLKAAQIQSFLADAIAFQALNTATGNKGGL